MPTTTIKIEGLRGVIKALEDLPKEIVSTKGGPVRKSLRMAARVLQKEARSNVQKIMDDQSHGDPQRAPTGQLKKSITVQLSKLKNANGEKYLVRVRQMAYEADATEGSKEVPTTRQVGRLLEYGGEHMPAFGWLRKAFDSHKEFAVHTFTFTLWDEIVKIRKKLGL